MIIGDITLFNVIGVLLVQLYSFCEIKYIGVHCKTMFNYTAIDCVHFSNKHGVQRWGYG